MTDKELLQLSMTSCALNVSDGIKLFVFGKTLKVCLVAGDDTKTLNQSKGRGHGLDCDFVILETESTPSAILFRGGKSDFFKLPLGRRD